MTPRDEILATRRNLAPRIVTLSGFREEIRDDVLARGFRLA